MDKAALRNLVDFQIDNGVHGLVSLDTTGESPTLSSKEAIQVIKIVVDQAKGRVPVIVGTVSNSTNKVIHLTEQEQAEEIVATASLQVAPYYNNLPRKAFTVTLQSLPAQWTFP